MLDNVQVILVCIQLVVLPGWQLQHTLRPPATALHDADLPAVPQCYYPLAHRAGWPHLLHVQGGALSMGEMMGRMADEAAGLLQGSERQLCAHLNALAVLTLDASAQPDTPGKGRQAPAGDSSDPPPTPKQKRSSRPFKSGAASPKAGSSHDSAQQAADGQQPGWTAEALQAAEGWLQQSRTVGEHGIAELEGKGKGFGSMALTSASHRAWRLIQACAPPQPASGRPDYATCQQFGILLLKADFPHLHLQSHHEHCFVIRPAQLGLPQAAASTASPLCSL